jgi:hypothetical protein
MEKAPKLPDFAKSPRKRVPAFVLGANLVEWQTPTGRKQDVVWVDEEAIRQVMDAYNRQANALPIFRDHNEADGAYGAMALEATPTGIDQIWTLNPDGERLAAGGRYLFDSPEILTRTGPDGRKRLAEIRSGSLVNKPARTGSQPLLMSAMQSETVKMMNDALEKLGGLEKAVKGLLDSGDAAVKTVGEALAPHLGPAIAALQAQSQQAQVAAMSAGPPQQTAQARDASTLGIEVLKMTGASNSDEALGVLEADSAQIVKMSSLLVKLGVETGRLEAAEADKYAKYTPARLVARLNGSEALQMSAKTEQAPPTKKDAEPDDSIYDSAITAGRIGGK